MNVTTEMLQRLVECVEAAVNYAEANQIPRGRTLDEMKKVLKGSQIRMGNRL